MDKTTTLNTIVKFLYRESPTEDNVRLAEIIAADREIAMQFDALRDVKAKLDKVQVSVPERILDKVLAQV